MYQQEFPHEELPQGVIHLSTNKRSKVIHLVKRYKEVGFTNYDLIELAELTGVAFQHVGDRLDSPMWVHRETDDRPLLI